MTNYRRHFIAGGSYFFTVNLAERSSALLTENIHALRKAWREVRRELPFKTEAIVVLPDHLHCIWTLPPEDADFSARWRKIKAIFSRQLPKNALRDGTDWLRHVDYVHYNPVKHGHVKQVIDWPYSTFHRYVRLGLYPRDWAGTGLDDPDQFEEG